MVEMKQPMRFPQWAVEDCFILRFVDPAAVFAVAQILMSNSCSQLGAQLSKVRVVVNGPADDCLDMTPPNMLLGATRLGQFQK